MPLSQDQYKRARDSFIIAIANVVPNGKVREAFGKLIDTLEADTSLSNEVKLQMINGAIQDGIMHGNWPQEPA